MKFKVGDNIIITTHELNITKYNMTGTIINFWRCGYYIVSIPQLEGTWPIYEEHMESDENYLLDKKLEEL